MTARVVFLVAAPLLLLGTGCGDESSIEPEPDPLAAGKDFVNLLITDDPAACDVLTEGAKDRMFYKGNGLGSDCQKVIERGVYADTVFPVSEDELAAALDEAAVQTEGSRAAFRLCMPKETLVTIELIEVESAWRVESVGSGGSYVIADGRKHHRPCRPVPSTS